MSDELYQSIPMCFYSLNGRYQRSIDSSVILYAGPGQHAHLFYDDCTARLKKLREYLASSRNWYSGGLRSSGSRNIMMLELIAAQLSAILVHWGEAVAQPARYVSNETDKGMCMHTLDIYICEGLDTLKALEDKADSMGIANYVKLLVPLFEPEPCDCTNCNPSVYRRRWHWACAQKYFHALPPAVFERMFSGLREDAEATASR